MIEEGKSKLIVREGVFYNKNAKLSRDIGVVFLSVIAEIMGRKLKVCEPLSATGARGIRYALETQAVERIVLNDKQKIAYENILENVKLNNLENIAIVENKDANLLLEENAAKGKRFDFIDLDPFGSPVFFIQPAVRSLAHKGYLALAATDTAALNGVAKEACLRKYLAKPLKNEFMNETGMRILIAACIRIAAFNEVALEPVFCHATMHYMRAYFRMYVSISKLKNLLSKIGYLAYCPNCLWRGSFFELEEIILNCPHCNHKTSIAGPLWLGEIYDEEITRRMLNKSTPEVLKLISLIRSEINKPPFYCRLDSLSSKLKVNEPKVVEFIEKLREIGYEASRTHFSSKGIKTNAPHKEILNLMKSLSRKV